MKRPHLLLGAAFATLLSQALPRPQAGRLASGLQVAGLPVGGLTRPQFERLLREGAQHAVISFRHGDEVATATWGDLGLELDLETTWQQAYAIGHGADRAQAEYRWLKAGVARTIVPLACRSNPRVLSHFLNNQAEVWAEASRTSTPPAVTPDPCLSRPPGALNVPATCADLTARLTRSLSPMVICATQPLPPSPSAELLQRCGKPFATRRIDKAPDARRRANIHAALVALNGLHLDAGGRVDVAARLGAFSETRGYVWAVGEGGDCLVGQGQGVEAVLRALAGLAAEAHLSCSRYPLPPRLARVLPYRQGLVLSNPTPHSVLLQTVIGGSGGWLQLRAGTSHALDAPTPSPLTPGLPNTTAVRVDAVGDILPCGFPPGTTGQSLLPAVLSEADLTCANLEAPVAWDGEPTPYKTSTDLAAGREFIFRATPDTALPILRQRVDVVSLANNHTLDYGPAALRQTVSLLAANNIAHCGAGSNQDEALAPAVAVVSSGAPGHSVSVAFVAFVHAAALPGSQDFTAGLHRSGTAVLSTNPKDELTTESRSLLRASLRRARERADVVVASFHWGHERSNQVDPVQRVIAHQAIEWGADAVIGHHPHRLQPVESYRGHPIFYSLGNFMFASARGDQARTVIAHLLFAADGRLLGASLSPYQIRLGVPRPMTPVDHRLRAAAVRDLGL